jgi:hypothetical protein
VRRCARHAIASRCECDTIARLLVELREAFAAARQLGDPGYTGDVDTRASTLAFVVAFVGGCAGPVPVFLTTSDQAGGPVTDPSPRAAEVLDAGFGAWGLQYELVGPGTVAKSYGAIDLALVEVGPGASVHGSHHRPAPCRQEIWSDYDGNVLAHELGHAWLGSEHHDDPENLMHAYAGGETITDRQWDDAQGKIERFLACADGT